MSRSRRWRAAQSRRAPIQLLERVAARLPWAVLALFSLPGASTCLAQSGLPDAPTPQFVAPYADSGTDTPEAGAEPAPQQTFPPAVPYRRGFYIPGLQTGSLPIPRPCIATFCSQGAPTRSCCISDPEAFNVYLKQYAIHIYTPRELGGMAVRSVVDPFNLLTIAGTSAFSVATDSHSPYGPGFEGWGKLSGVSLTQDMTNAFLETFLIPSIDHQDPHYHRLPNASMKMRIAHCIYQPVWTDDDLGRGMFNYATVVGDVLGEAIDSSYVPYRAVGWGPSADRVAVNLVTTPIGNFVTEFVPDLASHINLNVVFVQRIINRVAVEEGGGAP
jgi:hypothetical protein